MTSANCLFEPGQGITFDDFILLPGFIDFGTEAVSLEVSLTENIKLKTPILSSPMDTVTEDAMAISIALQGGLGIIHYNNTITQQTQCVAKVKRFCHGFIRDPVTVGPCDTVGDVKSLARKLGFSGFPVVNKNTLMGLIGQHDLEATDIDSYQVAGIMQHTDMVTAPANISLKEAFNRIKEKRVSRLPIIDEQNHLVALVCRKDMNLQEKYPLASRDQHGRLLVGAAVSTHPEDRKRIDALVGAGVDVLVVDSSQGYSSYQIETIKYIKKKHPNIDVIAGNVVTKDQAMGLVEAGANALRVGMGSGSCCTTQDVCGVGRALASAIYEVSQNVSVPIIADGGIRNTGHMIKALACGASAFMLGSMLAATHESPGLQIQRNGIPVKAYRGMGSIEAMKERSGHRYLVPDKERPQIAQGVSGFVKLQGSIEEIIPEWVQAIKQGFQDLGITDIVVLRTRLYSGSLRFEKRTYGSMQESQVHMYV